MTKHYGYIRNGRLQCQSLAVAVRSFPEGTSLEFTVRKSIERRSSPQNRYFHGVVLAVAGNVIREHGTEISNEQLKEAWKMMFAPVDVPTGIDGEFVTVGKSTADMDTMEFGAFVDSCVAWCAERGIIIPAPNEQIEMEIED